MSMDHWWNDTEMGELKKTE